MKRFKILATLIVFGAALFTSCGDTEPIDPAVVTGDTSVITGRYRLTAFNTDVRTDLNNDGTTSTNQMSETTCYNNMFLTLNENNTFSADSRGVDISATDALECFTDPIITGTWVRSGSQLILTYTESGETFTDTYTILGDTLTIREDLGTIVGIPVDVPVFLTSGITIVYTKQ